MVVVVVVRAFEPLIIDDVFIATDYAKSWLLRRAYNVMKL